MKACMKLKNFSRLYWHEAMLILLTAAIILAMLSGCTAAQVDRAEQAVAQAKEILAKAEIAEGHAAQAVAMAKQLAEQIGSEKAKDVIAKAEAAMAVVADSVAAAKLAVTAAESTAAAAKASQAAGGNTVDLLIAGLTVLVPSLGGIALAVRKAISNGKALKQTIRGVDKVREVVGEAKWATEIAPHLEAAQDESVKTLVAKVQASA